MSLDRRISQRNYYHRVYKYNEVRNFCNNFRKKINRYLNGKKCNSTETMDILGIDIESYITHLELQFKEGMNWKNKGYYGWHIDHIIPLSTAKTIEEVIPLLHFSNTQPLWMKENLIKNNKILSD